MEIGGSNNDASSLRIQPGLPGEMPAEFSTQSAHDVELSCPLDCIDPISVIEFGVSNDDASSQRIELGEPKEMSAETFTQNTHGVELGSPVESVEGTQLSVNRIGESHVIASSSRIQPEETYYQVEDTVNDVGLHVGESMSDVLKFQLLQNHWTPPQSFIWPSSEKMEKGQPTRRYLSNKHIDSFPWIVYSPSAKGIFCKYCVIFSGETAGHNRGAVLGNLVKFPLQKYNKLTGKDGYLSVHDRAMYHKECVVAASNFIQAFSDPKYNISNRLETSRMKQIIENRQRILPIIKTVLMMGRQNIAFRGRRDDGMLYLSDDSGDDEDCDENEGNFREMLKFRVDAGEVSLENHLKSASSRATYISKTTQNIIVECCGEVITKKIVDRVKACQFFAIIFDETTDISRKAQLSFNLRYLHNGKVREDFVKFIDCYEELSLYADVEEEELQLTGKNLGAIVLKAVSTLGLDILNCVGVGTDGCSVMVSDVKGAVVEILKEAKCACRTPCYSHALNLSISRSSNVAEIRNTVQNIKSIINFFRQSAKKDKELKKKIPGLCETRWVERHDSILKFLERFQLVTDGLCNISRWRDSTSFSKAKDFLHSISNMEFLVDITSLADVLQVTFPLSRQLQLEEMDMEKASQLVANTISALQINRSKEHFRSIFQRATSVAKELNVEVTKPRIFGRGNTDLKDMSVEDFYRVKVFFPLCDEVIGDMVRRFSEDCLNTFNLRLLLPHLVVESQVEDIVKALKPVVAKFAPILGPEASNWEGELAVWRYNPSYFTIPGGLSSSAGATAKGSRFSLLKRHIRMGTTASSQSPAHGNPPESSRPIQQGHYNTLPSTSSSGNRLKGERYSSPPSTSSNTITNQRTTRSQTLMSPLETQMLILGMPRASDIAPLLPSRHARQSSLGQPYRSTSDLIPSYCNLGGTPPNKRHSIGSCIVRKSSSSSPVLTRKLSTDEEDGGTIGKEESDAPVPKPSGTLKRGNRTPGMEDIIIISSQRSPSAQLWVTYLKTCFEQIRKNRKKPPFKLLCINVEDVEDSTPMTPVVESKLRQARLEIVIVCPIFLEYVLQYPERMCKLAALLQPKNVLAMLLGVEEKSMTEQHSAALISFNKWRKMESVRDRDEKFVSDFLGAAMEILGRTPTAAATGEKCSFMIVPKKVNQAQKKVVLILNDPIEKEDVIQVNILRNGEEVEVPGIKRCNPYTIAFRVPEVYLGVTSLVTVRVNHNGRDLGGKQLKCESQLHALEQLLKGCDNPVDFLCQALNIAPTDSEALDEIFIKAFQQNVPRDFHLVQSAGLGQIQRGAISKEKYPTLLHFAARFGLEQLSWALLECPGGDIACDVRNVKELTPADMAEAAGHARLSNILSGYTQMNQFSNAYALLKGMADGKREDPSPADEYLSPRPIHETYQIPPTPRPCPPRETPPPIGYMPMRSPLARLSSKSSDSSSSDRTSESLSYSTERLLCRSRPNSEQHSEDRKRDVGWNGIEEELIEIISDFKSNVLTISEVESLVEQWRRRNDVQQSFREKQEHLNRLREEYERVQQRMKDDMKAVGRPSPMERIRNFFRGKPKNKVDKKKRKNDENLTIRPESRLSVLTSSSSSSGRMSPGSSGDSSINSEAESDRKPQTPTWDTFFFENYDIPPSPISVKTDDRNRTRMCNYDVPPSPVALAAACGAEYCNLNGKKLTALDTVMEENKTDMMYVNLPEPTAVEASMPEYINVETKGIELSVQ